MDLAKARTYNQRQGWTDTQIKTIAAALGVRPTDVLAMDDGTIRQIAAWQTTKGLVPDGMVGPATLAKMGDSQRSVHTSESEGRVERRIVPNFIHEAANQFPDHRHGIDLSLYNKDVDPTKLQGVSFCILKATQDDFIDPKFLEHRVTLAKAPQVALGNYHLPIMVRGTEGKWERKDMAVADPIPQARFAASIAKKYPAAFMDWLDTEPDSVGDPKKTPRHISAFLIATGNDQEALGRWVGNWFDVFENEIGQESGFYFSQRIAREGGEPLRVAVGRRVRWIASYSSAPKLPWRPSLSDRWPKSWGDAWDIRQCRGSDDKETREVDEGGKCLGVGKGIKDVDQNVLNPASPLMQLLRAA